MLNMTCIHHDRREARRAPEAAITDPEAFLALLDTEVYWDVA
jgi:hypothetical protein